VTLWSGWTVRVASTAVTVTIGSDSQKQMSEFLYQIQKRGNLSALSDDAQGTELLSKIPPPNLREADLRLGILFNGLAVSLFSCDLFSFLTV
jgi:hypothetical protein